ncbi:MAG: nitrous oxide reductase accessory protein NosL, partial [Campylobacterota bacterium]|nr:nitrous oxide reductase accessory protein NosL [Campylobacterota bacterium]
NKGLNMYKNILIVVLSTFLLTGCFKSNILLLLLMFSFSEAKMNMFQSVSPSEATIVQTGEDKMYCPNCGMFLPKFWKTSHAVKFRNGTYRQFCSMYCLVEQLELTELRGKRDTVQEFLVTDVKSLKYIDAYKAFYVVASSKKGTMTVTSKYAFKDKKDAEKFKAKNGGDIMNFNSAYNIALTDFARDTGLVFAKRSSKMYKKGKMIYNNKCNKNRLEKLDAHTMGNMKALIKNSKVCGDLNNSQLQAVMLYFWDVRLNKFDELYGQNKDVEKHAKKFQQKFENMDNK